MFHRMILLPPLVIASLLITEHARAQTFLMVTNSSADGVSLLDPNTGAVVDSTFIEDDPTGLLYDLTTPKDVIQVGSEIWITDQLEDSIFRFDLAGNYLSTIDPVAGMLDNIRGACFANGTVYVTNDGSQNGASADSVVMFDPTGVRIGEFITGTSPYDVVEFNGEILVADFTDDTIRRHDYAGNFLGNFHSSNGTTGIDNIEQLAVTAAGGIVAAGFTSPSGVYVYDGAGAEIDSFTTGTGVRGVYELPNGNILYTEGSLDLYDPVAGTSTTIDASVTYQFINPLDMSGGGASFCFGDGGDGMGCTPCPCGNNAMSGSGGGCLNSAGLSASLLRSGSASVSSDSLRFEVRDATAFTFGILSSGDNQLPANAINPCFGLATGIQSSFLDGLRCTGGAVQRHGTRPSDAMGDIGVSTNGWGPPNGPAGGLIAQGGFVAGQTRHYQCVYRENPAFVCATGQNTTQGVTVTFSP